MGKEIILEKRKYCKITIDRDILAKNPAFVQAIKADSEDKMGWKKYKAKLKKLGYDV